MVRREEVVSGGRMVFGRATYVLRWKKLKELRSYSAAIILAPEAPLRTIAIETIFMLSARVCLGGGWPLALPSPPASQWDWGGWQIPASHRQVMCVVDHCPLVQL